MSQQSTESLPRCRCGTFSVGGTLYCRSGDQINSAGKLDALWIGLALLGRHFDVIALIA